MDRRNAQFERGRLLRTRAARERQQQRDDERRSRARSAAFANRASTTSRRSARIVRVTPGASAKLKHAPHAGVVHG